MDLLNAVLIGIGLSMDCFAVSLALGSTTNSRRVHAALLIALCFGGFQAGMMVLGWVAGNSFIGFISSYDHWVAFILLLMVGGNMMREGMQGEGEKAQADVFRIIPIVALSLATSIDSLAVGVSYGILQTNVLIPSVMIGIVCGTFSFAGVLLGERLEDILGNRMEIIGGLILIAISVRILAEHLLLS